MRVDGGSLADTNMSARSTTNHHIEGEIEIRAIAAAVAGIEKDNNGGKSIFLLLFFSSFCDAPHTRLKLNEKGCRHIVKPLFSRNNWYMINNF